MFDSAHRCISSCSRGASLCRQATTSTRLLTAVSLFDQAPTPCYAISPRVDTSAPAARATMSWHGQAKKPMMLRGQSVSASVPDAQGPSPWSSVGAKGAVAVVWPQSMLPGSSPWLCGKPVWWAPRHGGVAGPGQVRVCAAGIGRLGSELASLKPMQRRRGGALAPRRTSTNSPKTRGRAAGRPSRSKVR